MSFFVLKKCEKYPTFIKLGIIIATAVTIRLIVMLSIKATPVSDFDMYYYLTKLFLNGGIGKSNYIAYFPHIVGYPFVLSKIFSIFGTSVDVAVVFNILCNALTSIIVFYLTKLLLKDEKKSYWASAVWSMWPSQIFMCLLVSTEPLFTLGLTLFTYLVIWSVKKFELRILPTAISFALLGVFCALLNALRPIGLLIMASSATYLMIYFFGQERREKKRLACFLAQEKKKIVSIALAILFLFAANSFVQKTISSEISKMIKQDVASFPVGFNIFVGSNAKTYGMNYGEIKRSTEIFSLKNKNNLSAQEIHNIFLGEALNNVKKQGLSNVSLFIIKNAIMWLEDARSVGTIYVSIDKKNSIPMNPIELNVTFVILMLLTEVYYWFFLYLVISTVYRSIKEKEWKQFYEMSFLFSMIIFSVGLYCLVEVQSRYHYPILPMFAIIAVSQMDKIKFFRGKSL